MSPVFFLQLHLQNALHAALDSVEILVGGDVVRALVLAAGQSQILRHDAVLVNRVDTSLLEALGKCNKLGSLVKLAALNETAGPGEDGGNGVGRRLVALLMLAVVTRDGAVSSLGLKGLAIGGDENRSHETEGTEALSDNVGLDITIVV